VPYRRTRQYPQRARRPNRAWSGFASTDVTTVAASSKVLIGGFTLSNTNIDETILRTVGLISVVADQVAATENQIGAFGLILVNDLAVAAGVASVPGPVTDREDDGWFVYVPIAQRLLLSTAAGFDAQAGVQYHFDSKGRRRVEEGFQIAIVVENASAAHGFNIATVFRVLTQI